MDEDINEEEDGMWPVEDRRIAGINMILNTDETVKDLLVSLDQLERTFVCVISLRKLRKLVAEAMRRAHNNPEVRIDDICDKPKPKKPRKPLKRLEPRLAQSQLS